MLENEEDSDDDINAPLLEQASRGCGWKCECIRSESVGLIERFGKYDREAKPGLHFVCWPFESVGARVSTALQQIITQTNTKTRDNVGISIKCAIQYYVRADQAVDMYYKLSEPHRQIEAYVDDVVRSALPAMTLDEAYVSKNVVSLEVKHRLNAVMSDFGLQIKEALVVDLTPDGMVMAAMNEVNRQHRLRIAIEAKAEAEKIIRIKRAEASAEAAYLHGKGTARQREVLVKGMKDSVAEFQNSGSDLNAEDVMALALTTQHLDMLAHMDKNAHTVFFAPGSSEPVSFGGGNKATKPLASSAAARATASSGPAEPWAPMPPVMPDAKQTDSS